MMIKLKKRYQEIQNEYSSMDFSILCDLLDGDKLRYRYIARSSHQGHLCDCLRWYKGKVKAYCWDCGEWFIGISRCMRKVN